jgi:hypothetical protein
MCRYNIVSRILLIITVITFALAAPALIQEKRQACVDGVHAPEDVITVLRKRAREQDLWLDLDLGLTWYENAWGNLNPADVHLEPAPPPRVPPPNPAEVRVPEVNMPPQNPAEVHVPEVHMPPPNPAEVHVPEVHMPPQNPAEVHVPEVHVPPQNPEESDRESMDLDDEAPPPSPESGHSRSPPGSPEGSTESEDWHTAPGSPGSSTESDLDSDLDSDHWSTISNAPSAESLSENLKAADSEMRGKAKVSRRISGTASGADTVKRGSDGVAECG